MTDSPALDNTLLESPVGTVPPAPVAVPPQDSFALRTAWLATARFASLFLSFLLPFILVRKLSTNEFGLYKQAFQLLQTGLSLLGLQVSGSIYSFIPRYPAKKAQIAMNAIVFYALVGGLVALWFVCFPGWVRGAFNDDGLVPVMPLVGLAIFLWLIASAFESVMIADNDVRRASVISVALQFLKTGLLVFVAIWRGDTHTMVLAAVIFGLVHCLVFLVYLARRFGHGWWHVDAALLREQLANALPFGVGAFAFGWQYDLHNYFVARYYGPTGSALYTTGGFLLPLLLVLLDAMDTIMIPEVARLQKAGEYRRIAQTWLGAVRTLAFFFMPACALFYVLRYELIVGLYTENFAAAVPIFAVSLLNTLLLINLTGSVMRAFDDLKNYRTKLYVALMPLTVGLLFAGKYWAGLLGIMAAVVFIRALDVTLTVRKLAQCIGMTRADLVELQPLGRIALAISLPALAVWLARPWIAQTAAQAANAKFATLIVLALGSSLFAALYLPLAFACGAVGTTERALLNRFWRRLR